MQIVEYPQCFLTVLCGVALDPCAKALDDLADPALVRERREVAVGEPHPEALVADAQVFEDPPISNEDLVLDASPEL